MKQTASGHFPERGTTTETKIPENYQNVKQQLKLP